MLVTQCPRCHESVCVPDELLMGHGKHADSSAKAQCPWCLETLDGSELRAILPPALVLIGDHSFIGAGAPTGSDWAVESDASEFDAIEIDHSENDEAEDEFAFQQTSVEEPEISDISPEHPPQRVIKISVPGKASSAGDISAAMMDIDSSHNRRRSRKGSPLKTMIGVVLGGLLALPIVGTILHFATGQYVPYISDFLPGGGSGGTKTRANQPMPVDFSQPQFAEQSGQTTLDPQRIDGEIRDVPSFSQLPDPADSALQAITGSATNASTEAQDSDPNATTPDIELPDGDNLDTDFPSTNMTIPDLVEGTAATDDAMEENTSPDRSTLDAPIPGDDLFNDALPAETALDSFDPSATLPDDDSADRQGDAMEPATGNDSNDSNPADAIAAQPNPADAEPDADMSLGADDLLADDAEVLAPNILETVTPPDEAASPGVDDEVKRLTNSLEQLTGLAADDPQRGEQTQQLYESLTELAGSVPADSAEKLSPLIDQIAANTSLVIAFAKATPAWVSRTPADRGSEGVVVVGKMSGDVADATFILLNRQELPVILPESVTEVPSGFQIGVGRISGSGADASLTLELLQSIKQ